MLTAADEWFVHQTPEPIAVSGTDRNFYDRAFFGAFKADEGLLVAAAFGMYPHLNVADAHLTVVRDGVQHCLHASKTLHSDRATLEVGPVRIEIVEPLHELRLVVDDEKLGADLRFTGRHFPIEEPRFIHRFGPRAFMDYTRLSQATDVAGTVHIGGETIDLEGADGVRDRSWGIRPIGAADPAPMVPAVDPQFFWLWTPTHLPGRTLFWHQNADGRGRTWNSRATIVPHGAGPEDHIHAHGTMTPELEPGTRWIRGARLHVEADDGTDIELRYTPKAHLEMQGIGYRHPEWTHGVSQGEFALAHEQVDLAASDPGEVHRWHRQLLCDVEVRSSSGREFAERTPNGIAQRCHGILEHLVIGPYEPLGLM